MARTSSAVRRVLSAVEMIDTMTSATASNATTNRMEADSVSEASESAESMP